LRNAKNLFEEVSESTKNIYPANRLTSKKRWKSLEERKLICTFAPAFSENPMHLTM